MPNQASEGLEDPMQNLERWLSQTIRQASDEGTAQPQGKPEGEQPRKHSPFTRALQAALSRCRGGHVPELMRAIEEMEPGAQQALLTVIRNLEDEAHSEKRKRQQGRFW